MWTPFHHPDFSGKVIRRTLTAELLDFVMWFGDFAMTGGRSFFRAGEPRKSTAYLMAADRLRAAGLVATSRQGAAPRLCLTDDGRKRQPDYINPERHWRRPWKRYWYVLLYDVPESNRGYRNTLRRFLRSQRMGLLQQSVWISPDDIRPVFADLKKAASAGSFCHLLEAKTVLGQTAEEIVQRAWNFDRLFRLQHRYWSVGKENLKLLRSGAASASALGQLAREEMTAYHWAMEEDPLLPSALHPPHYLGRNAHQLHMEMIGEIRKQASIPPE